MARWTGQPKKGKKGEWWVKCPVDGITYHASQMRKRWDGVMVGPNAELERHPQEFLKVRGETPVPFSNPGPADNFLQVLCTAEGRSAYAGAGTAGCMITGSMPGIDLPDPTPIDIPIPPPDFFLLQEDGISKIILEDGLGFLGLE